MNLNGYVKLTNFFTKEEGEIITRWANELEEFPEIKDKWMIYFEEGKLKSRIEHFLPYRRDIDLFITTKIKPLIEEKVGKKLNLMKDKMNWKNGGAKGFASHQDHPAWDDLNSDIFYSIALFPDGSTKENGCLEFVEGKNKEGIFENDLKEGGLGILKNEDELVWKSIETTNRDLLFFDSFVPHRSHKNNTDKSRRVFYFTYNPVEFGDYYQYYYEKKKAEFPPDIERDPLKDYNYMGNKYNLANPIL